MTWPALIFSSDLIPDQGRLNGRRWSAQLLLRLWLEATQKEGLDLLGANPQVLESLRSVIAEPIAAIVFGTFITDPSSLSTNGALFVPDPSLGLGLLGDRQRASSVFPDRSNPHSARRLLCQCWILL